MSVISLLIATDSSTFYCDCDRAMMVRLARLPGAPGSDQDNSDDFLTETVESGRVSAR